MLMEKITRDNIAHDNFFHTKTEETVLVWWYNANYKIKILYIKLKILFPNSILLIYSKTMTM